MLQTKPWDGRDPKMANMLAVGKIPSSDCSDARGRGMVKCMPTFAPAWKAQVVQNTMPFDDARETQIKPADYDAKQRRIFEQLSKGGGRSRQ